VEVSAFDCIHSWYTDAKMVGEPCLLTFVTSLNQIHALSLFTCAR
jgi:hypothetical protein